MLAIAEVCKKKEIPYHFSLYITDWDTLYGIVSLGVTDVLIAEDLGFDLERVSNFTKSNYVKLRLSPNIAQSKWNYTPTLWTFFVRAEDVAFYEPYVDVFEFFYRDDDFNYGEMLYKTYAIDEKWFGPLHEYIDGLEEGLNSKYILPNFGQHRVKCRKRCMQDGVCRICEHIVDVANYLKENKKVVVKHSMMPNLPIEDVEELNNNKESHKDDK